MSIKLVSKILLQLTQSEDITRLSQLMNQLTNDKILIDFRP
jgi:hypothetical protein